MCERIVTIERRECHHRWVYVERLDREVCIKCHDDRKPAGRAAPKAA